MDSYAGCGKSILLSDIMQDPILDLINVNSNDADELYGGLWPFMKHLLMLFLPIWVFLLLWSAGVNTIFAGIAAGFSITGVIFFEKIKLTQDKKHNQ